MSNTAIRVHWSFWLIAILALVWNGLGAVNFVVQIMMPGMTEAYRESEQAMIASRPWWATIAFAFAVFGGTLGGLLLLLRRWLAYPVFAVSLIGVTVTIVQSLFAGAELSTGELVGIVLMPFVLSAFFVSYTKFAAQRGWLT